MNEKLFDFLLKDAPDLAVRGNEIGEEIYTNCQSAVMKARLFIEEITKRIAIFEKHEKLIGLTLGERTKALRYDDIIP